jgi:hypothetical protein
VNPASRFPHFLPPHAGTLKTVKSWSALEENQTVFLTIIISYSMHLDDVVPRLFPAVIWIE